jgi:hypothetical protein
VKGEAAALLVHAQHCQSHYFSATPRITGFITEFVNFDAEMFYFLWNVQPEDDPALEFTNYLVHCQKFGLDLKVKI